MTTPQGLSPCVAIPFNRELMARQPLATLLFISARIWKPLRTNGR